MVGWRYIVYFGGKNYSILATHPPGDPSISFAAVRKSTGVQTCFFVRPGSNKKTVGERGLAPTCAEELACRHLIPLFSIGDIARFLFLYLHAFAPTPGI